MAITISAAEMAEKWARRSKGATEDIRRGINAVTEAPGEAAARAQDRMRARLLESIDSGKWARNVAAVPLAKWKQAILDKGIPRMAAGVDSAQPKVQAFAEKLLSFESNLQSQIEGMPNVTLDDNIQRMVAWSRGMAQFSNQA